MDRGECIICGIFGAFKKETGTISQAVMRQLALLNESRGKDSFGYFSENSFLKRVGKISGQYPATWVAQNDRSRYICGHCRFATRGEVTRRNCHPFFFEGEAGTVVGIHNGVVPAPYDYTVDSEWIFDGISKEGLSFLEELDGYWGLAFVFNGEFYLAAHSQELSFCFDGDVLYFSSDSFHLQKATGCECFEIDDIIIKINEDFSFEVTEIESGYDYGYESSYNSYNSYNSYDNEEWKYDKKTKSWIPYGEECLWLDEEDPYEAYKRRFHQLSDEEWELLGV